MFILQKAGPLGYFQCSILFLPTLLEFLEEVVEKQQSQMHRKTWEEEPPCSAGLVLGDLSLQGLSYQRMDKYT